jgi:hypothetical protein
MPAFSMPDHDPVESRLVQLRSNISDLGHAIDLYKAKTGAALGAGVFLLLLAAGAAYDLITDKGKAWLALGIARDTLVLIAVGLAATALIFLGIALVRVKRRDTGLDTQLDEMEQEYADLLELTDRSS